MKVRFKTEDKTQFEINTQAMKWSRLSALLDIDNQPTVIESGELRIKDHGVFELVGRNPQSEPGNGLCLFGAAALPYGRKITVFLRANTNILEGEFPEKFDEIVIGIMQPAGGSK